MLCIYYKILSLLNHKLIVDGMFASVKCELLIRYSRCFFLNIYIANIVKSILVMLMFPLFRIIYVNKQINLRLLNRDAMLTAM